MSTPLSGHPIDPEEMQLLQESAGYWRRVWNETPVQEFARLEESAKQLIGITAGLQGLYVAIFAFSTLRTQIAGAHWFVPGWVLLLSFFTPLCCWLFSLSFAIRVFRPPVRPDVNLLNEFGLDNWQRIKDAYKRANEEKLLYLRLAHRWLVSGFLLVLLAVVLFALLPL